MRTAVLAVLAVLITTSIAAAQAPGETMTWDPEEPPGAAIVQPAREPAQPTTVSYRGQILTADAISLGLMIVGPVMSDGAEGLAAFGATGYFLAAPAVHLSHGRAGAAAKSLALRAGLPMVGAIVGYRVGPSDIACSSGRPLPGDNSNPCSTGSISGMLLGFAAGGVTAIVLDAKYLAKYETRSATPTWSASLRHNTGGMTVSVGKSF